MWLFKGQSAAPEDHDEERCFLLYAQNVVEEIVVLKFHSCESQA